MEVIAAHKDKELTVTVYNCKVGRRRARRERGEETKTLIKGTYPSIAAVGFYSPL